MPSYRVVLTIGMLASGVDPAAIVPAAADAARSQTTVEASDLAVVGGQARVTVRFTGDDDQHAGSVAADVIGRMSALAEILAWRITRCDRGDWTSVSEA